MRLGVRSSKVFDTKREAQAWGHQIESQTADRAIGWRTLEELCVRYTRDVSSLKKGRGKEANRIMQMLEIIGDKQLCDINQADISKWRDARLKSVSASTVLREANVIRHMFNVARVEWRWMDNKPHEGVKWPKEADPRHQRWTWKPIKMILKEGRRRGYKTREVTEAFHVSLRTGMRLKEVLMAPECLDVRRRVVVLPESKTGRAEIPVGRIACRLLQREPFTVGANEASTLFAKLTKQLLIDDLTFHDARATALTLLAKKVPVEVLAKISRHKDVSLLVNTYYRPTADDIARLI